MHKMIVSLVLFVAVSCRDTSVSYTTNNVPVQVTPPVIITPRPPLITKEECLRDKNVWIEEEGICKQLEDFKLPPVFSNNINEDLVEYVQVMYAATIYSIGKFFTGLPEIKRMNFVEGLVFPAQIDNGKELFIEPYKVTKADLEVAILERGVNDSQLEAMFQGFGCAMLSHITHVRNMILTQVKKLPLLNSVTFKISGRRLQNKYQVIPDNKNYIVVIDPAAVTKQDIVEILKQLK
jgi:hypothetical protein